MYYQQMNHGSEVRNVGIVQIIIYFCYHEFGIKFTHVKTGRFVNQHPSIQVLGLSFLILIGFMLIAEAAHLSHLVVFDNEVEQIEGYLQKIIMIIVWISLFTIKVLFSLQYTKNSQAPVHYILQL